MHRDPVYFRMPMAPNKSEDTPVMIWPIDEFFVVQLGRARPFVSTDMPDAWADIVTEHLPTATKITSAEYHDAMLKGWPEKETP